MAAPVVDPRFAKRTAIAAAIAIAVASTGVALAVFRKFVLLVLLGLVLTELFQAIADPLARRFKGPRTFWIIVAVLVVLGAVAGVVALCVYPLADQASTLLADFPRVVRGLSEKVDRLGHWIDGAPGGTAKPPKPLELDKLVGARLGDLTVGAGSLALGAFETFFQALAVISLGVFVAATPLAHRIAFLSVLPEPWRPRGRQFIARARQGLRNWMVAVTFSMGVMGTLVTTGLWLIGVPYYLVFGVFAGAMELIPYLGPVLAFSAPFLLCLASDPSKAVWVGGFYLVAHGLEANVIVPLIVKSRAHVPPSLVVLAILFFGGIAGIVGLIAATPVLTIVLAAIEELWLEPHTTGAAGELPVEIPEPRARAA